MSANQPWAQDAIDVALAAELEGSLSCLGIELGTENYDMSAPLHSLSSISVYSNGEYTGSHENGDTSSRESPFPSIEPIRTMYSTQAKKTRLALSAEEETSSAIKRFCTSAEDKENSDSSQSSRCRHSSSVPDLRTTGSPTVSTVSVLSPSMLSQMLQISDPSPPFIIRDLSPNLKNTGFQYVLGAATSIATKVNEETMTYLNQGQSYEIKLKKLGDLTEMRGKLLKSIIRVGFQERRLQYSEKEQIAQWQKQRPAERILEIDIPFSYGLYDVKPDPKNIHICEFLWDPTAESGVFIKLNCISTEFTPKKHGGEKGAPFRIQIETFSDNENYTERLHIASCQVKVFKPKGADRKHKTDREKMSKRPQSEQEKYKTSYDCTVFSECAADSLYVTVSSSSSAAPTSPTSTSSRPSSSFSPKLASPDVKLAHNSLLQNSKCEISKKDSIDHSDVSSHSVEKSPSSDNFEVFSDVAVKKENDLLAQSAEIITQKEPDKLSATASATAVSNWLKRNVFSDFVETFQHYQGVDMLRLNQEDCIKICGLIDGLRLYNTLQDRPLIAKKVIFARYPNDTVYQAVYLHELNVSHLTCKLSAMFNIRLKNIQELQIRTGSSASFFVTDEVVINMPAETLFVLELLYLNDSKDRCILLLNPVNEL